MHKGEGKIVLRTLRRLNRRSDDAKMISRVLRDEDLCELVCFAVEREFGETVLSMEVEGEEPLVGGGFLDFFKRIFENQESIIAFIKKIIALFPST